MGHTNYKQLIDELIYSPSESGEPVSWSSICSPLLRLLLLRVTGSKRRPILSTLSISPRSMGLPTMKGPVDSCCVPSFARLVAGDTLPPLLLPLPLCRGVPSIWGMEERSGGVNGRNGPGLGTRGFLLVGCIDCAGACNKNRRDWFTRGLSINNT